VLVARAQEFVDHQLNPEDSHGGDDGFRDEGGVRIEADGASGADPHADVSGNDCDEGCNEKGHSFVMSVAGIVHDDTHSLVRGRMAILTHIFIS
jgi:hypothetical protein